VTVIFDVQRLALRIGHLANTPVGVSTRPDCHLSGQWAS